VDGWIIPTTAADLNHARALKHQLLGLTADPVVPVTWSVDANVDGFYTATSVSVDAEPGVSEIRGAMPYSVSLRRVGGGLAKPRFETMTQSILRTNAHSVTAPTGIAAAYYTPSYAYDIDVADLAGSTGTITTEDGTVTRVLVGPLSATTWRHWVKPADFYKGMCRLELKFGSVWYPVHGTDVPLAIADGWRIGNGFARGYPSNANTTKGIKVEVYDTSAWNGQEMCRFTYDSGGATWTAQHTTGNSTAWAVPKVLHNRPELVAVQVIVDNNPITFSIRPGDSWIEASFGRMTDTPSRDEGFGITSTYASTSFTGGIRGTADDGNGLRYAIAAAKTGTKDTTNGRVSWGTDNEYPVFALAADDGAATSTFLDRVCAARSERRMVVTQ